MTQIQQYYGQVAFEILFAPIEAQKWIQLTGVSKASSGPAQNRSVCPSTRGRRASSLTSTPEDSGNRLKLEIARYAKLIGKTDITRESTDSITSPGELH